MNLLIPISNVSHAHISNGAAPPAMAATGVHVWLLSWEVPFWPVSPEPSVVPAQGRCSAAISGWNGMERVLGGLPHAHSPELYLRRVPCQPTQTRQMVLFLRRQLPSTYYVSGTHQTQGVQYWLRRSSFLWGVPSPVGVTARSTPSAS